MNPSQFSTDDKEEDMEKRQPYGPGLITVVQS